MDGRVTGQMKSSRPTNCQTAAQIISAAPRNWILTDTESKTTVGVNYATCYARPKKAALPKGINQTQDRMESTAGTPLSHTFFLEAGGTHTRYSVVALMDRSAAESVGLEVSAKEGGTGVVKT